MSKPQGVEQRYYDHFLQGGGWGKEDQSRYDNYMKATKGLDKELAWKALDGGQQFDREWRRYATLQRLLVKERDTAKAKSEADAKAKRDEEARAAAKAKVSSS